MTNKKTISIFELVIVILSVISFSYFVSTNLPEVFKHPGESKIVEFLTRPIIPLVSANQYVPSGCCLETKSGAICQEMNLLDSDSCKADLIGTSCNTISECQTGCCYDQTSGICSLNSPKQKCESNGAIWSANAQCNIAECQIGCCVLGDSVSMTTNRECTILSKQYKFDKKFLNLDSIGSCMAYQDLTDEGACLTSSNDYSGKNNCVLTTKQACTGVFKKGYLCTSQELNTNCQKTQETSCFDGKDQIYFIDDCGNRANIYDSSKANNQSYWEKIIPKSESCQAGSSNCGNCDYSTGSICKNYDKNKDAKPQYGDNVCRNLNCGERKHGESWCVYDVDPLSGISPVGSGSFLAKCIENEISISSCGGFNQEICAENRDESSGFSEAKCLVNDWRACLNANDASSYSEAKTKCDENPQCVMFNDFYGEDNLKRSDGKFLAGFDPEKLNEEQGSMGDLGKDQNKVIPYCVPKFTPGFQFWSVNSNPLTNNGQKESTNNYGGSIIETNALCSLASFTCISKETRDCSLAGGCGSWNDDDRNWECNSDGKHSTIKGKDLPAFLAAMNERCRAIGSCGISSNILGQVNSQSSVSFSVGRIKIDAKGKTHERYDVSSYNLSSDYLSSISKATKKISSLKEITSLGGGPQAELTDSAGTIGNPSQSSISLKGLVSQIPSNSQSSYMAIMNFLGPLTILGMTYGWTWLTTPYSTSNVPLAASESGVTIPPSGYTLTGQLDKVGNAIATKPDSAFVQGLKSFGIKLGATIIGAYLGVQIGGLIAKKQNWSPGKQQAFIKFMGAVGGTLALMGTNIAIAAAASGELTIGGAGLAAIGYTATGTAAAGGATAGGAGGAAGGATAGGAGTTVMSFSWLGVAGVVIAILYIIYEAFLNKYEEQEYYILQYTCGAWEPPKNGNCNFCNSDVRPCSEYRCRSLGQNCHYFNENGEPGYCASMSEIWKASIKPWPEIISSKHKYSSATENSFKIEGENSAEVPAWTPVTFGIITDKQAICKIGLNHSLNFDQMGTTMLSSLDSNTGKQDGMHHQITLSPSVTTKDYIDSLSSITTLPIETGENNYYIKCRNFAGQENEAAFTVRVIMSKGPDLTPPTILSYDPADNSYLKFGNNNLSLLVNLNEPAECKYSLTYDYNSYAEMPNNMSCLTDAKSAFYGFWPCFANIENLTENTNQIFIRCLDQPNLVETELIRRIETPRSFVYNVNKCNVGLNVQITNPISNFTFEGKDSIAVNLSASTTGCIKGGEATCSFNVDGISSSLVSFLHTGNTVTHTQTITGLDGGNHNIFVSCEDEAGNIGNATTNFKIIYDNIAPIIIRVFMSGGDLVLKTNEPANCVYEYSANATGECNFGFENAQGQAIETHTLSNVQKGTYYVKCRDAKLNEPLGCTEIIGIK